MPSVSVSIPSITNLAEELERQLSDSASAARATVGDRSQAFAWTSGMRPFVGVVFNSATVTGLQFRATTVKPSATPAAKVAPGAAKPNGVVISTASSTLPKYAGYAEVNVEDVMDTSGLIVAIEQVLIEQALAAFCVDIATVLDGATLASSADTWSAAILGAIGMLPSANVLVVSPADVAAIVSPNGGWQLSMADAVPTVFGLGLVILPGLASGKAYVAKSSALTLFESLLSPTILVDPYSLSTSNKVRVVGDLFAAAVLTDGGGIVEVTVAAP